MRGQRKVRDRPGGKTSRTTNFNPFIPHCFQKRCTALIHGFDARLANQPFFVF